MFKTLLIVQLCAALFLAADAFAECSANESGTFYVVRQGWHTGLVIERDFVPPLPQPQSRWVELGWGQRNYYMSDETSVFDTARAALPSKSVLHVVVFDEEPSEYFCDAQVIELHASPGALNRISKFVYETFAFDEEGKVMPLRRGLYGESKFYSARPVFWAMSNCNTWIGRALQKAGCKTGRVVHADSLMRYAEKAGKKVQCRKR